MAMPKVMTPLQPCEQCGATLPHDSTAGLCPACLVRTVAGEDPVAALDPAAKFEPAFTPRVGLTLGDYRIEAPLGEGGMGVVYRARQLSLNRVVALKMLPFGRFAPDVHQKRFRVEAEAIARLRHANIVTVFEIGEHDGQPFLSMEFVDGPDLARVLRERTLTVRESAELAARVARAIHYAHERGVAHRDLKPSNILLDADGQPRVTDFGLAKNLASDSDLTLTGQAIGSPHYIPPEQAAGRHDAPFSASDVYGLGAILYHLLTRRPPFIGETVAAVLQQLADVEPVPPRLLNPDVPRDLETICLNCLEKDAARRYATAGELADELERFQRDEPIRARPISPLARGWRWCRRRPAFAGLSAATALALVGAAITGFALWQQEQTHARVVGESLRRVELARAEDLFARGESPEALARLARLLRAQPADAIVAQRLVSALTHRNFLLPASPEFDDVHEGRILTLAIAGNRLATATDGGRKMTIWDLARGFERAGDMVLPDVARGAAMSNDGRRLAVVLRDGTVQFWETSEGAVPARVIATGKSAGPPTALQFDATGSCLLALSEPTGVELIEAASGRVVRAFPTSHFAEFSPDGRWLVTVAEAEATLWNTHQVASPGRAIRHRYRIETARFSPDSKRILTASADRSACIWEVATGERMGRPLFHQEHLLDAVFSPDGQRVLTASLTARGQLWDAASGMPLSAEFPQWRQLHPSLFSPDGLWLVNHYYDRIWLRDAFTGEPIAESLRLAGAVSAVRFVADGRRIATTNNDGRARLWDVRPGEAAPLLLRHEFELVAAAFSPDGTRVLTCSKDQTARIWSAADGRPLTGPVKHNRRLTCGTFDFTGRLVATGDASGFVRIWDASSGAPISGPLHHADQVTAVAFSADGRAAISSAQDGSVKAWDAATGRLQWEGRHNGAARSLSVSGDGRHVASVGDDRTVRLWRVADGARLAEFVHDAAVLCVAFSPDGKRVAAGDRSGSVRWWDVAQRTESGAAVHHTAAVVALRFSRDGRRLGTASWDQTARVWDAVTREPVSRPLAHGDRMASICFSPDGRHVLTASLDHTARVWNVATGQPACDALVHGNQVAAVEWSPEGQSLVTASWDGVARIWAMPRFETPPATPWLADLAEAMGGLRLPEDEIPQRVAADAFDEFVRHGQEQSRDPDLSVWRQWLLADRTTRSIAPGRSLSAGEHARTQFDDEHADRLRAALRFLPLDGEGLARWSRLLLRQDPERNSRRMGEAAYAAECAVKLAPQSHESWWSLAETRLAAGNRDQAREAFEQACERLPAELSAPDKRRFEKLGDVLASSAQ